MRCTSRHCPRRSRPPAGCATRAPVAGARRHRRGRRRGHDSPRRRLRRAVREAELGPARRRHGRTRCSRTVTRPPATLGTGPGRLRVRPSRRTTGPWSSSPRRPWPRRADRARGAGPATDACVTATPGPVLVVLVADCVPLVLADPVASGARVRARGLARHGPRGDHRRGRQHGRSAPTGAHRRGRRPGHRRRTATRSVPRSPTLLGECGARDDARPARRRRQVPVRLWRRKPPALLLDAGVTADVSAHLPTSGATPATSSATRDCNPCGRVAAVARLLP